MSSTKTPASPATVSSTFDRRSRRDSIASQPMSPRVDKEQLAMALDKIHNSASQPDVLTTFNDFGPPPTAAAPVVEPKGATSQQGLSGFYSRLKVAVGVGGGKQATAAPEQEAADSQEGTPSSRASHTRASHTRAKSSVASLPRGDSGATSSTFNSTSSSDFPGTSATSSSGGMVDGFVQVPSLAKTPAVAALSTSMAAAKPSSAGQALQKLSRAPASAVVDTANASGAVGIYQDNSARASSRTADDLAGLSTARRVSRPNEASLHASSTLSAGSSMYDPAPERKGNGLADITTAALLSRRDDSQAMDGPSEALRSPVKGMPPYHPALAAGPEPSARSLREEAKKPLVIDRLSIASASVGKRSPSVVTETSIAEASPISMSAHGSVYHESFAHDERPEQLQSGKMRIPGTTINEGAPEMVNARLEHMRKQVLSKEFWMADETCKECFLCGDPFSAFRRKHHCRTCGWIFDAKCTSTISGQKFGVPGNLRVCKTCLDIINRRDDSGSDSEDDPRLTSLLRSNAARPPSTVMLRPKSEDGSGTPDRTGDEAGEDRTTTTPMMAIPATRRIGDPSNRNSAILEIDAAPQLSRPSSSRSLKSMVPARPPSAGHMRHHSKHNFMWNLKPTSEERVPFRKDIADEMARKSKLPAFHDDNIIDPELAPYMSDESSGDEQMSIFATLASNDLASSLDPDKPNFGPFLNAGRKHRPRGEKSISGLSFTSRGVDDGGGSPSVISHSRTPARRRNMSSASGPASQHHLRSPRTKVGGFKGPAMSSEALGIFDSTGGLEGVKPTRPASAKSARSKLSGASMKHTRRLFRQLLDDACIPNSAAWEKALVPILRKCAEDVDPDTGEGDRMDIRHYVKLKKIPGGKPSDSSYVSGVIFTKNLALKSMPRRISHPRILIISFPIEYQRQQQHQFMSLEPVMSQEKEFLKMVVARIKNHQPEVVLAERNVAGLALQALAEAGIAVAYNVKASVIGAVSRFVGTPIISSMDMLSLPIAVGRCVEFEVKTFVNNDIPGRKKTYIYLSGCEKYLGSTIALRGTSTELLRRVKRITEFMVYVVYSLKLESCLLGDGCVRVPSEADYLHHTLSTMKHPAAGSLQAVDGSAADRSPAASAVLAPDTVSLQTAHSDESSAKVGPLGEPRPGGGGAGGTGGAGGAGGGGGEPALEASQPSLQPSTPSILSLHDEQRRAGAPSERQMPEDVPAPTFYSDMVEKYKTKILSSSPFVRFTQPYLLMKAREQETRLLYLKRLRDQDINEEERDESGDKMPQQQQFQLINPEMVHEIGQKAPRQVMEVLHAVHDAEYDKALYAYQTHMRQWENYIQGNLDLFDPYSHQNIVVLYSVTCTETKIPCLEPGLIGIAYYNELPDPAGPMDADCTLGQYVQDLCDSAEDRCNSNGCDQPMWQHHRTYVHGEARVTIFVEPEAKLPSMPEPPYEGAAAGGYEDDEDDEDTIFLWSYCKICKRDLTVKRLSASAWKYSFGKYLELLFWAQGLRLSEDTGCTHDCQTQHIRYFHFRGASVRIHYDPIDLLEIVVPRARLTWKVDHDLKLKNEICCRMQDRWNRFITSVKNRIKSIRIDSVLPDKAESCKAEVDRLAKKAHEEHGQLVRQLQQAYMQSKHYEIIPLNAAIRSMVEKIAEWDAAFAKFEADFLSDKDVRQLTVIQLRKMFTDTESKESSTASSSTIPPPPSATTNDSTSVLSESDVKTPPSTVPTTTTTTQSSVTDMDEKQSLPPSQPNESEQPDTAAATAVATPTAEADSAPAGQAEVGTETTATIETTTTATTATTATTQDQTVASGGKESAATTTAPPSTDTSPASGGAATTEPPAKTKAEADPAVAQPAAAPAAAPARPIVSPTPPAPSMLPVPVGSGATTSPTRPVRAGASASTQQTLSEKVEQLRREFQAHSAEVNQAAAQTLGGGGGGGGGGGSGGGSSSAGGADAQTQQRAEQRGGTARKSGHNVSPPIVRSATQPVLPVPRTLSGSGKQTLAKEVKTPPAEMTLSGSTELHKTSSEASQPPKLEKKFSDRIGLSALKTHRKPGPSGIPRFVHKKKESKVTSLARHFEQLSREFEKERNRERRQRAAKMHHPRAYFPKSSARAIVEVYDDVDQAVQEPGPIFDEQLSTSAHANATAANPAGVAGKAAPATASEAVPAAAEAGAGAGTDAEKPAEAVPEAEPAAADKEGGPLSPAEPPSQQSTEESAETATEAETDVDHKHESAAASDDEAGSDADQSLEDILPDVETIAEHLEPSGTVPTELQKDKKSNLMKMLSNFWAERSSSGWPQLDYPINPTDHIFIDSDVIVREDEPSSLIAFALSSEDYIAKLRDIRRQGRRASRREKKARDAHREATERGEAVGDDDDDEDDDDDDDDDNDTRTGNLEADDEKDGGVDEAAEKTSLDRGMDRSMETGGGNGSGRDSNGFGNDGNRAAAAAAANNINDDGMMDDVASDEDNGMEDFDARQVGEAENDEEALRPRSPESLDARSEEEEVEKSLLRPTGTHLKYQFTEGSARMMCKIFYAEQFDALRRKCGVADRIIESLSRCLKWDSKGGKTKSVFLKTLDDRFVMKALSPVETAAFLRFAPSYFSIMAEALFHDLPSVIAKMLGFFQVIVKNAATGTEIKLDLLIMENLFYDRQETRKFDLKGSMRNRKIQSTGEQNEVLLDENMVEYIYESPLFAREHAKKLLRASVWNDTLFLARQNVMDYSLMVAVDESRKELVVGIIDCIRTYTWDKKLESWIKDRGFAGGGRNRPTVTSPKEYKSRFREAMERYILQAPNCWHLFGNMPYTHPALAPRARFEADV